MDTFPVIIVGGGLAGLGAAYTLACAGVEVLVLERGDYPGAKNTTGGRLYLEPVRSLYPDLWVEDPPFERRITHEGLTLMGKDGSVAIDIAVPIMGDSASILRAPFDRWLAMQAENRGAMIMAKMMVTGLLQESGRVTGVRIGDEEIGGDHVIVADGTLSLLAEMAGIHPPIPTQHLAVGVKEVFALPSERIEERFHVPSSEGVAWLYLGEVTAGRFGGGFLYTNQESVSVGLVLGLRGVDTQPPQEALPALLDHFLSRREIATLLQGGEAVEYSAHLIPEGGKHGLLPCYRPGLLVAGDAAGFALNSGYTVRGMDYALASGYHAAQAIIAGHPESYPERLATSFVGQDFERYAAMSSFLMRPRLYAKYPDQVVNFLKDLYFVSPNGQERIWATLKKHFSWHDVGSLLSDLRWLLKT